MFLIESKLPKPLLFPLDDAPDSRVSSEFYSDDKLSRRKSDFDGGVELVNGDYGCFRLAGLTAR